MPDKRVHQLGFNAERAGCNKSHQVHQWFTPSTTMCNLDDDWLELLCSANRKLPSWQAETRARGKRADCRHPAPQPAFGSQFEAKLQACTRKGNHAAFIRRRNVAFARWTHDQSSSKVKTGSARPMSEDAASAPKWRPSSELGSSQFMRNTSPLAMTRQPCHTGSGRPRLSYSRAIPISIPSTMMAAPLRQIVC